MVHDTLSPRERATRRRNPSSAGSGLRRSGVRSVPTDQDLAARDQTPRADQEEQKPKRKACISTHSFNSTLACNISPSLVFFTYFSLVPSLILSRHTLCMCFLMELVRLTRSPTPLERKTSGLRSEVKCSLRRRRKILASLHSIVGDSQSGALSLFQAESRSELELHHFHARPQRSLSALGKRRLRAHDRWLVSRLNP